MRDYELLPRKYFSFLMKILKIPFHWEDMMKNRRYPGNLIFEVQKTVREIAD
eukprot:TRINITY_DN12132_c0_g1_i1.p1 TRINITY_DN12132_c0_g1~~TRINITY_DN12132_c0_g1_i1.p1  ORF type:complete len:52 (-),score=4.78 TRINITY_DN12132_c0_g1_i1:190-345(-)